MYPEGNMAGWWCDGYSAEGCGESGDTVAEHIAVKPFPGICFKIPRPPDQLIITVANNQPKMRTLIVFYGDIAVKRHYSFSLSVGERTGGNGLSSVSCTVSSSCIRYKNKCPAQ